MKMKAALWIVFATLSSICSGQQPPSPISPISYPFNKEAIPEMNGYKSVYIRRIDPDGIRIIHESGATKIPIEKLTNEQCAHYNLTSKGAAEYRKTLAKNELAALRRLQQLELQEYQRRQSQPPPPRPRPKFITAQQVKDAWIRQIQPPGRLDRNYKELIRDYYNSIASIRAGSRDTEAEEAAAKYNKNLAIRAGELETAKIYESEIARIDREETARQERASAAAEAERVSRDNLELRNRLLNLENLLREKSCTR
jgi:hypothetical protein